MRARDYLDWSRMSGLYLRNISHVDRHRTFQPLLSPAGLTAVIVGEFLEDTDSVMDVGAWRTFNVYEVGSDQKERILRTADALDAIGARRTADAVRIAQSNSPFEKFSDLISSGNIDDFRALMQGVKGVDLLNHLRENVVRAMPEMAEKAGIQKKVSDPPPPVSHEYESREQIEHLLEQFVTTHRADLERDLSRHGDPRQAPGYTREGRLQELEQLRKRIYATEQQKEDADKLQELAAEIRKLTGNPGEVKKKAQARLEKLGKQFRDLFKRQRRQAADERIPELASAMKFAEAFMASLPDVFAQKKVGDDQQTARLDALGEYETGKSGGVLEIQWDDPEGFECDWTGFSLRLCFQKAKPETLSQLLNAVDRLRQTWPDQLAKWRHELITSFRDTYWAQMHSLMDDYETDEEGDATDESILSHVESGHITLEIDPEEGYVYGTTWFRVEWDDEHGHETHFEDESDAVENPATGDEFVGQLTKPNTAEIPEWLKAIRADDVLSFARWMKAGGKLNESYRDRGVPISMQVIDYLASDASASLLRSAAYQKFYKPAQLRDSWMRYFRNDIGRFRVLMQVLPKDMWKSALACLSAWDHPDLWDELAESGVNFNESVDDEGQTPISLAVQCGKTEAVKWLLQHGADPNKYDKYQRNAFTWTDRGPGFDCLAILQGKDNLAPPRTPEQDVAAIDQLLQAARRLPKDTSLLLIVQIKSPPVTQVEKRWNSECHYRLTFDIQRHCVTFNDMTSARQDYLYADGYPAVLFLPILQWPELTPLWETVEVQECDWAKAIKKPKYQPAPHPELVEAAREALQQAFNAEEAAARQVRLRK